MLEKLKNEVSEIRKGKAGSCSGGASSDSCSQVGSVTVAEMASANKHSSCVASLGSRPSREMDRTEFKVVADELVAMLLRAPPS